MSRPLRVAIVGSGPSGMYAADALLSQEDIPVSVDIIDKLPSPFGLVRYGVAPDHLSIRSVRDTLDKVLDHPGVRFLGNVELGRDLHRMDTLLDDYKKRALESQALLHSMVDTTNQRQFILHLQDLVSRVDKDIIQASIELEGAKLAMMQATHQRMKMETMQEKDEQAVKTWERKRDQKEMDTLGLTLFNLKS